jgi:hypothetical protein
MLQSSKVPDDSLRNLDLHLLGAGEKLKGSQRVSCFIGAILG